MTHTHDHNNPNKLSFSQHKTSIIYRAVSPQCRFVWKQCTRSTPNSNGLSSFSSFKLVGAYAICGHTPRLLAILLYMGHMGLSENEAPLTNTMLYHRRCILKVYPIFEQIHIPFIWLNYNHSLLVAWKWLKLAAIWAWFPVYPCPHWGLDITTWGHDQLYQDIFIHINSTSHIISYYWWFSLHFH